MFRWKSFIVIICLAASAQVASAASWPASSPGTLFGTFPGGYEPSGAVWDDTNNYLYVVSDDGVLSRLNSTGTILRNWPSSGDYGASADFEGVTVTGTNSYTYVANEDDNSIYEFTNSTGSTMPTNKWSFLDSDWTAGQKMINADNNQGLEGIAYIPAGDWYDYGVFLGLQQSTGTIFVGRPNLNTSGNFTYVTQYTPVSGRSHPSDLFYSFTEKRLYVLYDDGYVKVLHANGDAITEYSLPSSTQEEGFALQTNGTDSTVNVFIANDDTGAVLKYTGFPQVYDDDQDGTVTASDCNDDDATVSTYLTVYQDYDSDGLGNPSVSQQVCSLTAPAGYVTNASDTDDTGASGDTTDAGNGDDTVSDGTTDTTAPDQTTDDQTNTTTDYTEYDAEDTAVVAETIERVRGGKHGRLNLHYSDGTRIHYRIFAIQSDHRTTVRQHRETAYYVVRTANKHKAALVNAFTGEVLDRLRLQPDQSIRVRSRRLKLVAY